jgi:alpha-mannosidase
VVPELRRVKKKTRLGDGQHPRDYGQSKSLFSLLLIDVLPFFLHLLSQDKDRFRRFFVDGQSQPYFDYFEFRPEKKAILLELIRQKKMDFGPWTTSPDEFLASGEAIVR